MKSLEVTEARNEPREVTSEVTRVTGEKKGHSCCGGCCDMRRAVMIVDTISALLALIAMIGFIQMKNSDEAYEVVASTSMELIILTSLLATMCYISGIFGAKLYNWPLVLCAASFITIAFIGGLLTLNILVVVVDGLFLYPHIVLIREIRQGIMTKENYLNERQSCCCV